MGQFREQRDNQALTAHSLASVVNKTIWLAKPSTLYDPFDCAITLDRQKYKQSVMHAVSVAMARAKPAGLKPEHRHDFWSGDKEAFEQFGLHLSEMLQNLGICSFSATSNHLLMWSHYGDHHRGFCVEYDCREGTLLRQLAHEVKYEDEIPSLTADDFAPTDNEHAVDTLWLPKVSVDHNEGHYRIDKPVFKLPTVCSGGQVPVLLNKYSLDRNIGLLML